MDTSALTGEHIPREAAEGEQSVGRICQSNRIDIY